MEINAAQRMVDDWIRNVGGGYFSELTNLALLTEEVGETARIIARIYGDQVPKPGDMHNELGQELADVFRVLLCLANQTGINLDRELQLNLTFKRKRDADRFAARREAAAESADDPNQCNVF